MKSHSMGMATNIKKHICIKHLKNEAPDLVKYVFLSWLCDKREPADKGQEKC